MMHMPIVKNGSQLQNSEPPIMIKFLPQEGKSIDLQLLMTDISFLLSVDLNLEEEKRQEESHNEVKK